MGNYMYNSVNKNEHRKEWKEGSFCEIFCKSKKKWFPGLIVRVLVHEKKEILEVMYQTSKTEITRFDTNIRPLMNKITDDEVSSIKETKARYKLKEGSFCEVYRSQEQKWYKAMIKRVFTNDRGERLRVLYGKDWGRNINRFSSTIRLPSTNERKDEDESTLQC
eukprot:339059_1